MLRRRVLVFVLFGMGVVDLLLAAAGFVVPRWTLEQMGISEPATAAPLLVFVISWLLLFVAAVAIATARLVQQRDPAARSWALMLGLFWIGLGATTALGYDRAEEWFVDVIPGLVVVVLAQGLTEPETVR